MPEGHELFSTIPQLTPEILAALHELRSRYKDSPIGFENLCVFLADEIQARWGFPYVEGQIRLDKLLDGVRDSFEVPHAWNIDCDTNIIDFSVTQFNRALIERVPEDTIIIPPTMPFYTRYIPIKKK